MEDRFTKGRFSDALKTRAPRRVAVMRMSGAKCGPMKSTKVPAPPPIPMRASNLDSGVIGVSACRRPRWQPNRREHEQTTAPEPNPGIQGEGGTGCRQGRADAGGIGAAI